eukprot:6075663-Ditylum_brightwellii.AAC.1
MSFVQDIVGMVMACHQYSLVFIGRVMSVGDMQRGEDLTPSSPTLTLSCLQHEYSLFEGEV